MFSNRIFQVSIMLSLAIHGIVLLCSLGPDFKALNKGGQKIEVNYVKTEQKDMGFTKQLAIKPPSAAKLKAVIDLARINPPPFVAKDADVVKKLSPTGAVSKPALSKPDMVKPDALEFKKIISMPPVDTDKITNSTYLNYYQFVREKIRRAAYQNYSGSETGQVYLSFTIGSDGQSKDVRFISDRSSSSEYLKEIALRSLREVLPFPVFPKELDYPQLSFNVVISFEVEQVN